MSWTDERVAELTRLWESGYSASAIGRLLGVSKNAVVGKAHRLRLQSRPSPIRRDQRVPARRRVPMPVKPAPTRVAVAVEPQADDGKELRQQPAPRAAARRDGKGPGCLWPLGDPGEPDFHFCGMPAVEGKPYCTDHCARAYITRTRAEEAAA